MVNKVQLITYINRIAANNFKEFNIFFNKQLQELFGGVHILPFYYPIDGEDAGFDPIEHSMVDPRLGKWDDLKDLSRMTNVIADLIVNHISAQSEQFKDYLEKGENSIYAPMFLTYKKIFGDSADDSEVLKIYRPRPSKPFTNFKFKDGTENLIWTSFTSNQIDIDVKSKKGQEYLDNILLKFQKAGIKLIRLDAVGYAIKVRGTSCFMIDETFDFISELTQKAKKMGMETLVEVHSYYKTQIEIAKKVDYVYDFALPVLVMDTLFNKNSSNLKKWIQIRPRNAFSVLDTHDGIGIVDVASEDGKPGLIEDRVLKDIVKRIHINSNNESIKATGAAASNLDLYQVNCTYYSALGKDDVKYLISRALQFFIPGIPQIYYVGLFVGENDMPLLAKTNVGRDINRHYFTKEEVTEKMESWSFKKLKEIILMRNNHKSFAGDFKLFQTDDHIVQIRWENQEYWSELFIDLINMKAEINFSELNDRTNISINSYTK